VGAVRVGRGQRAAGDEPGREYSGAVSHPGEWGNLISLRRTGATSYYGFDQEANARILMDSTAALVST